MWFKVGKMKTLELRSLLTGKEKVIDIPVEIQNAFEIWKRKRKGDVLDPLEIFYAGYIMSNPMVRDEYKKSEKVINNKI